MTTISRVLLFAFCVMAAAEHKADHIGFVGCCALVCAATLAFLMIFADKPAPKTVVINKR